MVSTTITSSNTHTTIIPNNIKMVCVCCDDNAELLLPVVAVVVSSDLRGVDVVVVRRPFKNIRLDRLTRRMGGWFAMRCIGGFGDSGVVDDEVDSEVVVVVARDVLGVPSC